MTSEIEQEVEGLRRLSRQQFKDRWRVLYKAVPPVAFTPDLMARGIAWRLHIHFVAGPFISVVYQPIVKPARAPILLPPLLKLLPTPALIATLSLISAPKLIAPA